MAYGAYTDVYASKKKGVVFKITEAHTLKTQTRHRHRGSQDYSWSRTALSAENIFKSLFGVVNSKL